MRRIANQLVLVAVSLMGVAASACQSGGVGDPCIPEDEYRQSFSGYTPDQVNIESRSFQCETRVCLAAYFQGRVSCPYGQKGGADTSCTVPGQAPGTANGKVADSQGNGILVNPQLVDRPPSKAVYCSCRCDGDDKNARYCECPSGYTCEKVAPNLVPSSSGGGQLTGSYCVKSGSMVPNPATLLNSTNTCAVNSHNCDERLNY